MLGAQNFGPGGIFSVFFVEIPGRAISGLCSKSGRLLGGGFCFTFSWGCGKEGQGAAKGV